MFGKDHVVFSIYCVLENLDMKVFLSYAKEDKEFILECYEELKRKGFSPWMDEHDLLPGQAWDNCLKANMKSTDVVLIFMSSVSVEKIGYVQREMKYFVDKRKDFPDDYIYIIPIQIDDCTVPNLISSEIQFININKDLSGREWNKVLRSLGVAAEQRNIQKINNETSKKISVVLEEISESVFSFSGYDFKAIYPQVQTSLLGFNEINELVKNLIFNKLVIARSSQFDEIIDFERDNDEPMYFDIFQNEISGEIGYLKSYFMSVLFTEYEFKGGAHGSHYFYSRHYIIKDSKVSQISPFQIFSSDLLYEAITFIEDYCYQDLKKQISFRMNMLDDDLDSDWIKSGCSELIEQDEIFIVKSNSLDVYFKPYSVTAYAFGDFIVSIPFYELNKWLNKAENSCYTKLHDFDSEFEG